MAAHESRLADPKQGPAEVQGVDRRWWVVGRSSSRSTTDILGGVINRPRLQDSSRPEATGTGNTQSVDFNQSID
jgi:hypothetical protein